MNGGILILHHVEPMWESAYKRFGTSFEELQEKVLEHLNDHNYDQVILTRFEDWHMDSLIRDNYNPEFIDKISTLYDYGYGWTMWDAHDYGIRFVDGGNHSEYVLIDDWMRELPKENVHIAGAFDGECIEDLEIALSHLEINFNRIEDLIV
jgi:hypothetical protein